MRAQKSIVLAFALVFLGGLVWLACSTDSPTAPAQDPSPFNPGPGAGLYRITVSVTPGEIEVNPVDPSRGDFAIVTVVVVRRDTGAPPDRDTVELSTDLASFDPNADVDTTSVSLSGGIGRTQIFAGPDRFVGTATVLARLENSTGSTTLDLIDDTPFRAEFCWDNSQEESLDNRSVQFLLGSPGGPESFLWDFGDGNTSTEANPFHVYAVEGGYTVRLTVFKQGASDTVSAFVDTRFRGAGQTENPVGCGEAPVDDPPPPGEEPPPGEPEEPGPDDDDGG